MTESWVGSLVCVLVCAACAANTAEPTAATSEDPAAANGSPAVATSEAAPPESSTESAPSEPSPAASKPAAPSRPDIVATPVAELKKLTKAQLSAAQKLGKQGDDLEATMVKMKAALGPHTFAIDFADADESHDVYYWSVTSPDGSCDLLMISVDKAGKTVRLVAMGTSKRSYTNVSKGEVKVDGCSGQPLK